MEHEHQQCPEYPTCVFRLELLEKWKDGVENKLNGIQKLLIANLTGIILTLIAAVIAALVWIARLS